MQDHTTQQYDAADDTPTRFQKLRGTVSTIIGALVAMSLLMALGIWFYRLGVRDAQNVPIIRAAAEPAKTRPEDPGGAVAPHQDMESFEVANGEEAQASAAVIATQPPAPKPEDAPMAALQPVEPEPEPEAEPLASVQGEIDQLVAAVTEDTTGDSTEQPAVITETEPAVDEPAGTTELALATPQAAPAADPANEPETPDLPKQDLDSGSDLAPKISPVALKRPPNLKARMAAAAESEAREVSDLAARAAASKVQVQLAADPNEAAIRLRWQKIRKDNADILRDRALAVQTTQSGGKTFYRLRVGPFKDAAEARSVCQALKGRGQDCIVARNS